MAAADTKADKKADSEVAIVAPRRSVEQGGKRYGPGAQVTLSSDDIAKLRKAGFLVDPDAAAATSAKPKVSITRGDSAQAPVPGTVETV